MRRRPAFSLVELMIVIGVIAVLVALLLPTLTKMREQNNRVICTSNMRDLGMACSAFANDHSGTFPMSYRQPGIVTPTLAAGTRPTPGSLFGLDGAYPYRFPAVLSRDVRAEDESIGCTPFPGAAPAPFWWVCGTAFATFEKYGMRKKSWICPSAIYCDVKERGPDGGVDPDTKVAYPWAGTADSTWGEILWTHYMYVGGISYHTDADVFVQLQDINDKKTVGDTRKVAGGNIGASIAHWGTMAPAITSSDNNVSTRVLAADMVFFTGGAAYDWDKKVPRYLINHRKNDTTLPAFQNILYGDGHVEGRGPEYYPAKLDTGNWQGDSSGDYSLAQCTMDATGKENDVGGFFYWGAREAALPNASNESHTVIVNHRVAGNDQRFYGNYGAGGSGWNWPVAPIIAGATPPPPNIPKPVDLNR